MKSLLAVSPRIPALRSSEQGESAPKVRPKGVADGNQVNIPEPASDAMGGTEHERSSGCWMSRLTSVGGLQANPQTHLRGEDTCRHGGEVIGSASKKSL